MEVFTKPIKTKHKKVAKLGDSLKKELSDRDQLRMSLRLLAWVSGWMVLK